MRARPLARRLTMCALAYVLVGCGGDGTSRSADRDAGAHDAGATGLVDAASPSPYAAMEALVRRSCMFTSCHGGTGPGEARLNFAAALGAGGSLADVLVGVPACEYDAIDRVAPHAPERSWLMLKLTGAHAADGTLQFAPDPAWLSTQATDAAIEPSSECPRREQGVLGFGRVMPISGTTSRMLPAHEIAVFRRWIEAGAPAR